MFLCRAQAYDTNGFFIGALGERQHAKARIYEPDGHESYFSIVKPVVFALKRRVPVEIRGGIKRHAMFRTVNVILGRIELDFHGFYVHPFNRKVKLERTAACGLRAMPFNRRKTDHQQPQPLTQPLAQTPSRYHQHDRQIARNYR